MFFIVFLCLEIEKSVLISFVIYCFSLFRNIEVSFFSISYVTYCFSLFSFSVRNRGVLFSHFLYYLLLFSA